MHAVLTRSDFESAVKDALRQFTRTDLLAGNALLRTQLLTRGGPGAATPHALKALLVETAKTLFTSERDQRLYRVLDLTYLNPVAKQEAAADRLGLSFSTYRRHLTASVDRLIEWLWQQEQELLKQNSAAAQLPGSVTDTVDTASSATRPRLSIVILPFLNLSGDATVEYIVDGIVDSLITDMSSRLTGSFIISRSTAFTYKGRSVAIRQVGEELGVRYVLEGSVLAGPSRVRVNVQLIDAETDEHLWAERFDKERRISCRCRTRSSVVCRAASGSKWSVLKPHARAGRVAQTLSTWSCVPARSSTTSSVTRTRRKRSICFGKRWSLIPTALMRWSALPLPAFIR
jgi:TolB-like protein